LGREEGAVGRVKDGGRVVGGRGFGPSSVSPIVSEGGKTKEVFFLNIRVAASSEPPAPALPLFPSSVSDVVGTAENIEAALDETTLRWPWSNIDAAALTLEDILT
jgi:hypothetical protein